MDQLWEDLKDLADARSLALAAAKEIHTFDRDAADAKERVQVRGKNTISLLATNIDISVSLAIRSMSF